MAGGESFGSAFFNRAYRLGFTNLESVYASNYNIRAYSERSSNFFTLDVISNNVKPDARLRGFLRFRVSIKDYYSGNLSPSLTHPLKASPVKNTFSVIARSRGRGEEHGIALTDYEQIKTFMAENGYSESVFQNIGRSVAPSHSPPPPPPPPRRESAGVYVVEREGTTRTRLESPNTCLLYTSPSPRDRTRSRMPSSA